MPANQALFSDTGYYSDDSKWSDTWYTPLTDIQGNELMFFDAYWVSPRWNEEFTDGSEDNWVNLETFFNAPPKGESVPVGALRRKSLNGRLKVDGEKVVTLTFNACSLDGLEAYCLHLWGSLNDLWDAATNGIDGINNDTGAVPCTITLKQRDRVFRVYNAWAHIPQPNIDYEVVTDNAIRNLELKFTLRTS